MVDLIRAEAAQVIEQQTGDPLPRQALVGVAQSAILFSFLFLILAQAKYRGEQSE